MYLLYESRTISQITGYSLEETLMAAIPLLHLSIKVAPAAIVLTAARLVVLEEAGKVVWRFVFVVAAAARAAKYAVRAVLAYMMNDNSSQNNVFLINYIFRQEVDKYGSYGIFYTPRQTAPLCNYLACNC